MVDFEWNDLIDGKSEINVDDINYLANTIKKIVKNTEDGGTIPEYLTNFFKEIPEGKTIDDLNNSLHLGCYIGKETQIVYGVHYEVRYILFVDEGLYVNNEMGRDEVCHFQTKYYLDAGSGKTKIKQRRHGLNEYDSYVWFDWQDVFATPQYVKEQIAKIPTDGGNFRLLADITADGATKTWTISKDIENNDLNLTELYVFYDNRDATYYQWISVNGETCMVRDRANANNKEYAHILLDGNMLSITFGHSNTNGFTSTVYTSYIAKLVDYTAINSIKLGGYGSAATAASGTTIKVYGR